MLCWGISAECCLLSLQDGLCCDWDISAEYSLLWLRNLYRIFSAVVAESSQNVLCCDRDISAG